MHSTASVVATLVIYNAMLIGVGLWTRGRNHDVADFFIGGRGLGAVVASISAVASSSSAWTLLGVSGAAYAWGIPALWILPATLGGFSFNWFWLAPRLRRLAAAERAVTASEVIAPEELGDRRRIILRAAAVIIVFCFTFYIASQFEAAGKAFESVFGLPKQASIVIGASIVIAYTLLGGFWAVSVTDTIQGSLMVVVSLVLPVVALGAVGGFHGLAIGLAKIGNTGSPMDAGFLSSLFFVFGMLGIGFGSPGQPHVVNRFMALKDELAVRRARVIAMSWGVVVFSGMLLLGLCARVLFPNLGDSEQAMFHAANELLPAAIAGIVLAAVLSAIMSTADSQLLVTASSISYDWNRAGRPAESSLAGTRRTVVVVSLLATALALGWRADIFSRVLFAWTAAGAAFAPILITRLAGRSISFGVTLAALLSGFFMTVALSLLPDTPGDVAERVLPFIVAFSIAMGGSLKKVAI